MSATACGLYVLGRVDSVEFQRAKLLAEELERKHANVSVVCKGRFPTTFEAELEERVGSGASKEEPYATSPVLIVCNQEQVLGSLREFETWAQAIYEVKLSPNQQECRKFAKQALTRLMSETQRTFCFFDVAQEGKEGSRRIIVELFDDICPKTCSNFKALCEGDDFVYCPFHRVVPGGWVQGGDTFDGSGRNSSAAKKDQKFFPDENFAFKFSERGVMGMANEGQAHTNGSQFFISLAPLPWLNCKRVAFGRVVFGMEVVESMEKCECRNERPINSFFIRRCGIFNISENDVQ